VKTFETLTVLEGKFEFYGDRGEETVVPWWDSSARPAGVAASNGHPTALQTVITGGVLTADIGCL
jgi:hypothetical protein